MNISALSFTARWRQPSYGGWASCWWDRVRSAPGLAPATGGLPNDFRQCELARSQRGHYGFVGRHSSGASIGHNRGCDGDDLRQLAGQHICHDSVDLSRDIDGAARDVEAAINGARSYLPANLPGNPTYRKVNPADAPIMILGLTSEKYGPDKLYDEASTVMEQKLSQIQGVGQVSAGGARCHPYALMQTQHNWPAMD